jgi:hypothetical protein
MLFVCLFFCLFGCLFVRLFVCLCVHAFVRLRVFFFFRGVKKTQPNRLLTRSQMMIKVSSQLYSMFVLLEIQEPQSSIDILISTHVYWLYVVYLSIYLYIYVCMYIYICIYIYMYVYIYMYIYMAAIPIEKTTSSCWVHGIYAHVLQYRDWQLMILMKLNDK